MKVTFRPTVDLTLAAKYTLVNMQPYYEQYGVEWDEGYIKKMTQELVNFDILLDEFCVGVMRLSFDSNNCQLRDLQISQNYQNKGIGSIALLEAVKHANNQGFKSLKLKVFKVSPAFKLYKRQGFQMLSEDERFYYMVRAIL